MLLRSATLQDVPALCELFLRLKRAGQYAFIPHDMPQAQRTLRQCISSATKYARVVESRGKICAALLGSTEQFWWGKRRYASDFAFFSQYPGAGKELVENFCSWAWKQPGVIEVLLGQSSGDAVCETTGWFKSLGFEHTGGMYRLTLYTALGRAA